MHRDKGYNRWQVIQGEDPELVKLIRNETDLGFTGGGAGAGNGMVYLDGKPAYKLDNTKLLDHVVDLCEKRAAEIEGRAASVALEPAL